ncbi:MAG: D-aminoacylase [Aminobacterium sp.]|uniref:N-acyl-D-amino-acid deacylase family protein n=1 Tax=Aminobacterium sp. TaxID=1872491 RepID=UPI002B21DD24|nr:D-aminoacylase [Aminobacterium sp.]MEA4877885.1 D-aminoacylase [Aminobacterium sp.]
MRFDIYIKNARIVDGTRSPWYRGGVGITDSKIRYVGSDLPEYAADAFEVIDAKDHIVAPGFIDVHTHSDFLLLRDPVMQSKLKQGVTTQGIGQCGISPAPISSEQVEKLDIYSGFIKAGTHADWNWRSFGEWLDVLEDLNLGTNIVAFAGQGTIRIAVIGFDNREPSSDEMAEMKKLVSESIEQGAYGITSGLVYPPGVYSSTEELVELCSAMTSKNGLYQSHMRNEGRDVVKGVEEVIRIAEENRIPAQISHHKALGRSAWGLVKKTLALVEDARKRGVDVTVDQYPYTSASTTLRAILPPWVHEGGVMNVIERLADKSLRSRIIKEIEEDVTWDNYYQNSGGASGVTVIYSPQTPEYEGKSLKEIAEMTGVDPLDIAMDIIAANKGDDAACYSMMCEDDVEYVLKNNNVMVISDSIPPAPGAKSHPRTFGTNPRVLGKYVRDKHCISLEDAIWKMTAFPASRLGLQFKGILREGMDADIVIFDPDTVDDKATFEHPFEEPVGIEYVIVNGVKTMEFGNFTGHTNGKVLRKG